MVLAGSLQPLRTRRGGRRSNDPGHTCFFRPHRDGTPKSRRAEELGSTGQHGRRVAGVCPVAVSDHIMGMFGNSMFHALRAMSMICIHIGDIITVLTSLHR
jgi:hypothetical protein